MISPQFTEYNFEVLEKIKNYFKEGYWILTLESY